MKTRARNHSLALLLASAMLPLTLPTDSGEPTPKSAVTGQPAHSDVPSGPAPLGSSFGGFDHIQAAQLNYNFQTGNYTIPDRFTATRMGTGITADKATGNAKKKHT